MTHLTAYKTRLITLTTFLVRTITTRTLLDGTLTVTVIQRQPGGQTGSSIQDQMLRLPGFLHR